MSNEERCIIILIEALKKIKNTGKTNSQIASKALVEWDRARSDNPLSVANSKFPAEYTRVEGKALVITIEAIYELRDTQLEEWLDEGLQGLQQGGSAEIVKREVVADTYQEAIRILGRRSE